LNGEIKRKLESIVGEDWLISEREQMIDYLTDETPRPAAPKGSEEVLLVKPKDRAEIELILKLANEKDFPVVPRGAGTGLCGAAIPTEPAVILSLERLNQIVELDEENMTITCGAGLSLEDLFERVNETDDLFFPPHPGDEGAQVGGLVIENAGGARAVKYGVMRNYVKGVKGVLPTGEPFSFGGKVLKNNAGYDIMHLLIGSEGTLGILTEVTLRLYPRAKADATLLIPFSGRHEAIEIVPKLLKEGLVPLAVEYVERDLIERSADHLGTTWPADEGEAYLILILTGAEEEEIFSQGEKIVEIATENGALEPLFAQRKTEQDTILDVRSNIYTALEEDTTDILDVTVPPAQIGDLLDRVDELAAEYETEIPCYGHAADGNIHPHIMNVEGEAPEYAEELKESIYKAAIDLGGVITGEHGIGRTRIKNLGLVFSEEELELMRKVKKAFDPKGILNPGAVVGQAD